jgi:hypothetical protein
VCLCSAIINQQIINKITHIKDNDVFRKNKGKGNHIFLNERAQGSAYFIDKEKEKSRLAGKNKKPLQINAQSRQALCACREPKRKFFLYLRYKCSYRRLSAVEDLAIPLFPNFPDDEERKGAAHLLEPAQHI